MPVRAAPCDIAEPGINSCLPQFIRGGIGFEMLYLRTDAKLRRFKGQPRFAPLRHPKPAEIVLRKRDRRAGESEVPRFQTGLHKGHITPHALRLPFRKVQRNHIQNGLWHSRILLFEVCFHLR